MSHQARAPSGFTLVELLVVITILATLMALLFPATAAIIENARLANCKNQIRHISRLCEPSAARSTRRAAGSVLACMGRKATANPHVRRDVRRGT
jgi:prepilin-type N-terminal cleavage/methylation domain-containing protein